MHYQTDDVRIQKIKELLPPIALLERFPANKFVAQTVFNAREQLHQIIHDQDDRLAVIVGPCSVHDPKAALEYANKLNRLRIQYQDQLMIIMRVYFEKPRTTVGWKGLINDPYLDNSFKINDGLRMARQLLLEVNQLGLPTAMEYLDMITPQYMADLMSWGAIGARTTESQVHRELASGLSCPVGFKNGTDGNIRIAQDAIGAAASPHHFLSVTKYGHSAIVETTGNQDGHIILRGGHEPNYYATCVQDVHQALNHAGVNDKIMIDCSHANSSKQYSKQIEVCHDVASQVAAGQDAIFGVMIESFLKEGKQKLASPEQLTYGQSITDGCIGWEATESVIEQLAKAVSQRNAFSTVS
jgi:3-deoxy-7-phosphoheptulonate synthase